ncbi:MAG: ATP-dependent sacrificial sulfur transferase LarE [Desulfobulbaceae bacterium]|nr:ATP-dependent sacrificial sulfur transferase LarE [Desulfobulbaceae bacterium]
MSNQVTKKYQELLDLLRTLPKLAVAYSGGVDSTLLCHAASTAKGPEQVLVLLATSCLLSRQTVLAAEDVINSFFPATTRFHQVDIDPLADRAFAANDRQRCYLCKSRIYDRLLAEMYRLGFSTLIDGTNLDDLNQTRPGLRALQERGIRIPLVEIGFTKADIREAARQSGLPNAELPSNSCLATRIATGTAISRERLSEIERWEEEVHSAGFPGCRVRPRGDHVHLEVQEAHWKRLADPAMRSRIAAYFQAKGFATVAVDLVGR